MTVSLRFKSFFTLLMAAVLLLLPNTSAFAGVVDYPPPQLKIKHAPQEYSQWCWSAMSVMILDYYGEKMTQSEYAKYVNGHTKNVQIMDFEFTEALDEKGITGKMIPRKETTYKKITSSIDLGQPVAILTKNHRTGNGHIILVIGHFMKDGQEALIINDPGQMVTDWIFFDEIGTGNIEWQQTWLNIKKTK
ncbi:papain-like cysteine protease family protein [Brevibacillus sp. SIMBA_040]|uniref:papain-like cysteine protease family protein n=1 Tax=unclassified Brevibacillus TaxID=2684853 RepID=UPI00397AF971